MFMSMFDPNLGPVIEIFPPICIKFLLSIKRVLYFQVTAHKYFDIPHKTIFVSFYMLITDGDCECLIVLTGFPVQFGLFIRDWEA